MPHVTQVFAIFQASLVGEGGRTCPPSPRLCASHGRSWLVDGEVVAEGARRAHAQATARGPAVRGWVDAHFENNMKPNRRSSWASSRARWSVLLQMGYTREKNGVFSLGDMNFGRRPRQIREYNPASGAVDLGVGSMSDLPKSRTFTHEEVAGGSCRPLPMRSGAPWHDVKIIEITSYDSQCGVEWHPRQTRLPTDTPSRDGPG